MESHSLGQLLLLLALIVVNGLFSMSETAVISARRVRLQQRADAGDDRAQAALALAHQPDRFLSTVQIGITLIGILSGALGESSVGALLTGLLERAGLAAALAKSVGFALGITLITYLSLVLGELVPKTLALAAPETLAARVARPMDMLSRAATPLVWVLSVSTKGLLRLFGVRGQGDQTVTQDEIKILIAQGTKSGVFDEEEQEVVERVFRTADRTVSSLMTPRREIVYLDVRESWEWNQGRILASGHVAFPVCDGGLDHVLGAVTLPQIVAAGEGVPDLRALCAAPLLVLESLRALRVLDRFQGAAHHLALVIDEYANVVGLLTPHDVLEAIVGEVSLAGAPEGDRGAVRREDGSWSLDGMLAIEEVLHVLELREEPEDAEDYTTLGGFVMARLEGIPTVGESFDWHGLHFEVLDMDGHRVDRVLVTRAGAGDSPTSGT